MRQRDALVFTHGLLGQTHAKTCHGILRGSDRFRPLAVVDAEQAGKDAGRVLDGQERGVPVYSGVRQALAAMRDQPEVFVVGVAFPGGQLPEAAYGEVRAAIEAGLDVVSGLHSFLSDDPRLAPLAAERGVELLDIRRPAPTSELHFWDGSIYGVGAARVAVLGVDCAVGKRTTCRFLLEAARAAGIRAEMIYTGQTGWMQGYLHGVILDATPNDFVSGELERAIVACDRELAPELILIEGQSSLRNPSGPCGSELLLSAAADAAVLQHAPGRGFFLEMEELGCRMPSVESEVELIRAYGVPVAALTLSEEHLQGDKLAARQAELRKALDLPVVLPLSEGVGEILPLLRSLAEETAARRSG